MRDTEEVTTKERSESESDLDDEVLAVIHDGVITDEDSAVEPDGLSQRGIVASFSRSGIKVGSWMSRGYQKAMCS